MIERFERAPEHREVYAPRRTYREACTPSREEQAQRLEALRYKSYPIWSLQQRIMQRLGDFGRKHLPFVAGLRWWF